MNILGNEIKPGDSVQLNMDIAKLHTRTKIEIPILIEKAKKEGPCLLITGGIHGDEVNGVEIVRRIISSKMNKPDYGTIIAIPVINVFGFINQSREFPDGKDLNRSFPGSKTGSLASRFAYNLMNKIIPHIDYCLDYHTGGAQRFNFAHIRIANKDAETLSFAKAFGSKFIQFSPNIKKSFRESLNKQGKQVILFEGGKSMYLDEEVSAFGVKGARNIIHHLKMKDYSKEIEQEQIENPIWIEKSSWIRARYSGMFRAYTKAGDFVEKGDLVGSISDPFGDFEKKITCLQSGYILNCNHSPIVHQGDALFHIGYPSEDPN